MTSLTTDLILGEPQLAGPLAVFPVLGAPGTLAYRSFAQAISLGAFVKELDGGASVGDLLVGNRPDLTLLAAEGEGVLGAQQTRSFDVSVLVVARARVKAPVGCVERGRGAGSRAEGALRRARHTVDPALRRIKREHMNL